MGFRSIKTILVAAALLTAACVAETPEVGVSARELGNGDMHDLPTVDDGDLGALPLCSSIEFDSSDCRLFEVSGSGGLFALECNGLFVCIGDAADLAAATVPEGESSSPPPGGFFLIADGTPIPAATHVGDGTPIPATAVADGTPIPAAD